MMEGLKNAYPCSNTSDCIEVSRTSGLYIKPISHLSITVTLPQLRVGQSISNGELMEKLKIAVHPHKFVYIKVSKSTLDFVKFDAETDERDNLHKVIGKIDQKGIKLSGFPELLKIRAFETKTPFPTRHEWDSYFRDAKHMNEMKPGERPDTVFIQGLPNRWFAHIEDKNQNKPSEFVLTKVLSSFGEVRAVDIPSIDPYRTKMTASIRGINTAPAENTFDAFVQFKEYIGFDKCMRSLQSKKLVFVENDEAWSCFFQIDFDKTKHMSEFSIKKRSYERDKLIVLEKERELKAQKAKEQLQNQMEMEKLKKLHEKEAKVKDKMMRRKQREENRRVRRFMQKGPGEYDEMLGLEGNDELSAKIALEERKLLIAQRKLESIRLMDELFERIKFTLQINSSKSSKKTQGKKYRSKMYGNNVAATKERHEIGKVVGDWISQQEEVMQQQRKRVYRAIQGKVTDGNLSDGHNASLSPISNSSSESTHQAKPPEGFSPPTRRTGPMRMDMMEPVNNEGWHHNDHEGPPSYNHYDGHYYHEYGHNQHKQDYYHHDNHHRGHERGRFRGTRGLRRGRGQMRMRGNRGRGRGNYDNYQKDGENPTKPHLQKPNATWFTRNGNKRGQYHKDNQQSRNRRASWSRSRSRSRSRSWSWSSRSRSRSRSRRRSRSYSRSRSKRKSHSSRDRSKSRRSRSRSKSRDKSRSRTRSKSKNKSRSRSRSKSKSRSRSKRSRSRSKGSRSRSRSRSQSKSKSKKSRSRSRSRSKSKKSRSRSRSRSKSKRSRSRSSSRSKSRKRRSRSRSRSKSRKSRSRSRSRRSHSRKRSRSRDRKRRRSHSREKKPGRNDKHYGESDPELSSLEGEKPPANEEDFEDDFYDPYEEEKYENWKAENEHHHHNVQQHDGQFNPNYRGRGRFMNYNNRRGGRAFRRGWRPRYRGRGGNYIVQPNYYQDKNVNYRHEEMEQYREIYSRYFSSVAERELAEKEDRDERHHENEYYEEERHQRDYSDRSRGRERRYSSRDREVNYEENRVHSRQNKYRNQDHHYPPKESFEHKPRQRFSHEDFQRRDNFEEEAHFSKNVSRRSSPPMRQFKKRASVEEDSDDNRRVKDTVRNRAYRVGKMEKNVKKSHDDIPFDEEDEDHPDLLNEYDKREGKLYSDREKPNVKERLSRTEKNRSYKDSRPYSRNQSDDERDVSESRPPDDSVRQREREDKRSRNGSKYNSDEGKTKSSRKGERQIDESGLESDESGVRDYQRWKAEHDARNKNSKKRHRDKDDSSDISTKGKKKKKKKKSKKSSSSDSD